MTQEEKVRAYDKALSVALETYKTQPMYRDWLEKMFPELKESENEMVRKALINGFNKLDKSAVWYNGITNAQVLAWLERQAEHANFRSKIQIGDKVTKNRDGVLVNLSQLNRVAKIEEKQGELKPTDEEMKELLRTEYEKGRADALAEMQKPAEWSDEDEKIINGITSYLCTHDSCELDGFDKWYDFLKSLKDRIQPQQERERILGKLEEWLDEYISNLADVGTDTLIGSFRKYLDGKLPVKPKSQWKPSEEDEEHIKSLLERLEGMCKKDATFIRTKFAISEDEDWLKSISPQSRWKPSNEQMDAFDAVLVYNPPCSDECRNHLITLYNELKKLKGE